MFFSKRVRNQKKVDSAKYRDREGKEHRGLEIRLRTEIENKLMVTIGYGGEEG